jgi:FG-GAP repeat
VVEVRRIAIVLVGVLVAAVWPGAGLGDAAQAAPAVTPAHLQADFNNDGFADLAAGAPLEDVGTTINAGAVSVLYGPVIGLSSETFTQDTPEVAGAAEPDDRFGAALAVGDLTP